MTIEQMIEVLQAYKEGKTIQLRNKSFKYSVWEDSLCHTFNFSSCEYRIKPEPAVYYAVVRNDGGAVMYIDKDKARVVRYMDNISASVRDPYSLIKVMAV